MYSAGKLASNPSECHTNDLRRVYSYLNSTKTLGLKYHVPAGVPLGLEVNSLNFVGFTDASYADDVVNRKSTSGYLFKFNLS
jgi:hypothetical protein